VSSVTGGIFCTFEARPFRCVIRLDRGLHDVHHGLEVPDAHTSQFAVAMANESRGEPAMMRLNVVELRQSLADILNRAEYRGERIVIHRRGKDAAAIIPIED
jgi:prevent-host-death family protein